VHLVKFDEQDPTWLTCPHCGQSNLHHDAVTVFDRRGEDGPTAATTITGHSVYREEGQAADLANPSSRRDGLAVSFWCEHCPAISELTIAQHKGITILGWRITGRNLEDKLWPPT
jgi:hypothetical protein